MIKYFSILYFFILVTGFFSRTFAQGKEDVFIGHTIPTDKNMMFYIQKNTNPNTVVYALKLRQDGKINPEDPMEVFWRRYQEDGSKKKLKWLERTFAFNFKVKPIKNQSNTYVFSLVAIKNKKIYVSQDNYGKPKVFMKIAGQTARLERIYVMVDDSKRIQSVLSMELFGKDFKTGKLIYEKIINN